jgi:acid stress chaperone HdeB
MTGPSRRKLSSAYSRNKQPAFTFVLVHATVRVDIIFYVRGDGDMRWAFAGVAGMIFAAIATSAGHAQVTVDVAKITCGQFLAYSIADPKDIALWLNGYYTGKRGGGTILDTQALKANYDQVRGYCLVNQNTPVMQAVETLFAGSK